MTTLRNLVRFTLAGAAALAAFGASAQSGLLDLAKVPLYVGANVQPLVMLALSKDQQLYKRAYNDYSDLDGDGVLETTYKHSISYYGYFDSTKCYDYDVANTRFTPFGTTADKYCTGANASKWAGNFLNWLTMTRMDAVRKLLYGGLRQTDTAALTVLERSYIPTEAHAFAKYYAGDGTGDIAKLTPFSPPTTAPTSTSTTSNSPGNNTDKTFNIATGSALSTYAVGDQVIVNRTSNAAVTMIGTVACVNVGGTQTAVLGKSCGTSNTILVNIPSGASTGGAGPFTDWTITNRTRVGISVCNATLGGAGALGTGAAASPQDVSQTNTNPPLMRVALGDYTLWAANERWQCYWREESTAPAASPGSYGGVRNNGNRAFLSGLYASTYEPRKTASGSLDEARGQGQPDYVVRVVACSAALIGAEKCKQYPSANFKPIGLLQTYGDPGLLKFGLMTGSYAKNVSGGVLRKNVGAITDEINVTTDGTFKAASLVAAYAGIINTLNRMRIWGYYYGNGTWTGAAPNGDNCNFQLTSITENNCTSWGNPMSEIYYEVLRYFAGGKPAVAGVPQPTAAYTFTNSAAKDGTAASGLGLPLPAWSDPLDQNTYCAPLNAIVINASVSTNDDNQIPTGSTKTALTALTSANLATSFGAAVAANTVNQWTDLIGGATGENINGGSYFVGRSGASTDEFCTAKTVTAFSGISGICPEGPTLAGSYLISGLAYAAHINKIRDDLTVPTTNPGALKVDTYGVQLATNVPQLSLTLSGAAAPSVIIQPTYRLFNAAPQGGGSLVDMRIIPGSLSSGTNFHKGSVYLNWEDSEQGGDYDQDMWGTMTWCMQTGANTASCPGQGANTVSVTTRTIAQSTANGQGFGYTISGTTKDGPHFHSGILGFVFTDSTNISVVGGTVNASGGCNSCQVGDTASTATYGLGVSVGKALNDPLWYASKWGGFKESGTGGNNLPDLTAEWDQKDATGSANPDGVPDNYFLVSNPLGLETALDKAFVAILTTSSASSVATNSTSLNTGSRIYQARFNSNDWSGQLLSFTIDLNGVIASTAEWDAGQKINSQDAITTSIAPTGRNIATFDTTVTPRIGRPFRWANLTATQKLALNTNIAAVNDGQGSARLDYLRGSATNEGLGASNYRRRITSKLGDIVDSNPQFVGPPSAPIPDTDYQTFKSNNSSRPAMIYLGANDGMLHGFDASSNASNQGKEIFAYVPSNVYYKLPWLSAQNYAHRFFVDGTPTVADVCARPSPFNTACTASTWRTVLATTQGGGGQSLIVLDVTNPYNNTEANAASWVLFEFRDADHGGRIGNVYGYPTIAKMSNGKWAVIISSGYNNSYRCTVLPCGTGGDYLDTDDYSFGRANMYVIFIENGITNGGNWVEGTDFFRFNTLTGSGASPNGFGPPLVVDVDADGTADYIYAGDLFGNFWKFDVTDTNGNNWGSSFSSAGNPVPLYVAKDPSAVNQIITAPAGFMNHPNGGYMLFFGTGRYLQTTDPNSPYTVNTFYAVWDWQSKQPVDSNVKPGAGPLPSSVTTRNSTLLQQQTTLATVTVSGIDFRVTSDNTVNYATQRGWYWDFPTSGTTGERMVVGPIIRNDKAIITTLVPSTTSCDAGGSGFLTDLDALTGSRLAASPFDVNGDRNFTTGDFVTVTIGGVPTQVAVSSRKSQVGITPMPTVIAGGPGKEFKVTSGSTGGRESILENPGGASSLGTTRRSWREILQN
jgi:type IV pilus assembly protein PilY1